MQLQELYVYSAVAGGCLFVVQLLLSAFAGEHHDDGSALSAELAPGHAPAHAMAAHVFQLLSLQRMSAFLSIFGLVGLAMHRESRAGALASLLVALSAGLATAWLLAKLVRSARKLESSGTLDPARLLGAGGTVYLGVRPGKPGKVTVTVQGRLVELLAVSNDEHLDTGTKVWVTQVLADGSVCVTRAF